MRHIGRLIVVGLALTGCGGSASAPPRHAAAPRPPADPLAAMHAQLGVGRAVFCVADPSGTERAAVRRFNRAHRRAGLRGQVLDLPSPETTAQALREVRVAARSGKCDVVAANGVQLADLRGALLDLTPYARARASSFFPAALAAGQVGGRQLTIPQQVSVGVLYVRAGVRAPATWEALFGDRRPAHAVMLTGDESPPTALSFLELLYGAGGRVLGPDGRAAVAGPAGRRALATLNRGWSDGAVTPSLDEDLAAVSGAFARGHGGVMPTESGLNPGGSSGGIRMAPLPHFAGQPPRPIVDGYGLAIPRRAPNRDGGLALLDGLTRAAAMQDFAPTGMASPLRASYGPGGVVATALRHGVPLAALPHSPAVIDAIARDVHAALAGDMSVDAALRRMAADIDSITRAPAGGAGA